MDLKRSRTRTRLALLSPGVAMALVCAAPVQAGMQTQAQVQPPPQVEAPPPAPAQDSATGQAPDVPSADSLPGATVVLGGDTLFRVYGRLGSFLPVDRAEGIAARVAALARTPTVQRDSIQLVEEEGALEIRSGEVILMSVTRADAAALGLDRPAAAAFYLQALQDALVDERLALNLRSTLIGVGLTLLASAVLALVFWGFGRTFPAVYRWIRLRGRRLPALRVQKLELVSTGVMVKGLVLLARGVRIGLTIFAITIYVPLVFSFFPATRVYSVRLLDLLLVPLGEAGRAIVAYIPNVFFIVVIVGLTYYALRLIRIIFLGLAGGAISFPGFYPDWAMPSFKILRFLTIAFAVVMIWPYLPRSDSAAFRGVAAFLGLLITFGAASAITNVVGGVVMVYMRPFQIGDRVKIADTIGDVIEKGLFVTRIRTTKHVEITIPNAMVSGSHIINYSTAASEGGVILHTSVTIGYDVAWRTVHRTMIAAALDTPGLLADPEPFVLQTALGDYSVAYEINAYTKDPNRMALTYSELHQNLQDRFAEAGIEILSPAYQAVRDGSASTIPASDGGASGADSRPEAGSDGQRHAVHDRPRASTSPGRTG